MSQHAKVAVETRKQMLQHHQNNNEIFSNHFMQHQKAMSDRFVQHRIAPDETSQLTSCNIEKHRLEPSHGLMQKARVVFSSSASSSRYLILDVEEA
jgi:hypothetical protein